MAKKTTAPPKGDAKGTTAPPVNFAQLVQDARNLAQNIYCDWATIRELEESWLRANIQNAAASKAMTDETIPNECSGSVLTELLTRCRTNREERNRCRTAFDESNQKLLDVARLYKLRQKELTDIGGQLALVPPDAVLADPAQIARACAVEVLVRQVGERAFKTDYLTIIEERQKAIPQKPAPKKLGPPRETFQLLFDALTAQVTHAIAVYGKTLAAKKDAKDAVDAVTALDEQPIIEPMKPTAEEVGRYLFEVDQRARLQIPAQRSAAVTVLKFRREMLQLYDAFKDLAPPLRKMGYLEAYQIEVEVEALIVASRKISDYLKQIHFQWMRLVDKWSSMSLDTSTPVEEQPIEEIEIIDLLQVQVRNLGVAVANKSIAGTKFHSMANTKPADAPKPPCFSFYDPTKLDEEFDKAAKYLGDFAAVALANELEDAKRSMASDAFDARQELARRLSAKLAHTVDVIGNTLKKPMSDQLRVMFFGVRTLHRLNGGPAANAKG